MEPAFRRLRIALPAAILTAASLAAQVPSSPSTVKPSFEVASIRPNETASNSSSFRTQNQHFSATNVSLLQLMRLAYGVQDFQIEGRPGWSSNRKFDIEAKAEDGVGEARIQERVQALLEERFKLRYRRETKEGRVLALTVAKSGHKLKPNTAPCDEPNGCTNMNTSNTRIQAEGVTMADMATRLTRSLNETVLDRTELPGKFDLVLEWTPDGPTPADGPSIYTALQEQLGLKLESQRGPVDTFIIENVEMPSDN